jgi:hypothetical protein
VPIFNPEVSHQIRLADKQTESTSLNLRLRKRQLAAQIKEAYFNYLMTTGVVKIYREALDLGAEGRRINQRLLEHAKGCQRICSDQMQRSHPSKMRFFKRKQRPKMHGFGSIFAQ